MTQLDNLQYHISEADTQAHALLDYMTQPTDAADAETLRKIRQHMRAAYDLTKQLTK